MDLISSEQSDYKPSYKISYTLYVYPHPLDR